MFLVHYLSQNRNISGGLKENFVSGWHSIQTFSLTFPYEIFCSTNLIGWLDSVWRIKGKFNTEVQQGWPSAFAMISCFRRNSRKSQQAEKNVSNIQNHSQNYTLKPCFHSRWIHKRMIYSKSFLNDDFIQKVGLLFLSLNCCSSLRNY